MTGLTRAQVIRLVTAIDPNHVENKRGMSYMAQHEVRAELTRIFGFGNWDSRVETMELLYETKLEKGDPQYPAKATGQPYYVVCYRAAVRLRIRDYWGNPVTEFLEWHAEENAPLPNRGEAHAMAMTSVESYALRRAAIGLGDRLGLGLYDKGSQLALVRNTLQLTDPESPLYVAPTPKEQEQKESAIASIQAGVNHGATSTPAAPQDGWITQAKIAGKTDGAKGVRAVYREASNAKAGADVLAQIEKIGADYAAQEEAAAKLGPRGTTP